MVIRSSITQLYLKVRLKASVIFELETFSFTTDLLSYQLFIKVLINFWYLAKKSIMNWIFINSTFWIVCVEITKTCSTATITPIGPPLVSCYVKIFCLSQWRILLKRCIFKPFQAISDAKKVTRALLPKPAVLTLIGLN